MAGKAIKVAAKKASPVGGAGALGLGAVARRAAGKLARKAIPAGAQAARRLATRAGASGAEAMMANVRQLPIQRSVDVAVPLEVAWDEWMQFDFFPEGAHRVKDVERDGDHLYGHVASPVAAEWEAEIIEERPDESFAWRSTDGSDCVGLITFHRLGERLTRIELNLDVHPVRVAEALALAVHLADRRAGADLRRFKAHVELIDPDSYADVGGSAEAGDDQDAEEDDFDEQETHDDDEGDEH